MARRKLKQIMYQSRVLKFWVLIVIFFTSSGGMAEDIFKSARSVWPEINNEMFIGSARGDNHTKNKDKLTALWHSKKQVIRVDRYSQKWKSVTQEEIAFNPGAKAKSFVILYQKEVAYAATQGAALFQWGCDGGNFIPVLNLGRWPFLNRPYDWGGLAIEVDPDLGLPRIVSRDMDVIFSIPEVRKILDDPLYIRVATTELYWGKLPDLRVIYLEYSFMADPSPVHLLIYNIITKEVQFVPVSSMFDLRC